MARVRWLTTPEALAALRDDPDIFLLCVADVEQYNRAHVPGSVLIPVRGLRAYVDHNVLYPQLNAGREPRKDQPILVYCWWKACKCPDIPTYSQLARQILLDKGYTDIAFLNGGMPGWLADGLPVEGELLHLWDVDLWR
ncbi:MAG TPA: rhodanese-like domain-containing protein [Phycisphaerae bacterium]|nr:rhodanese-like domain-containing protein [Phycisphaerae bacterium]